MQDENRPAASSKPSCLVGPRPRLLVMKAELSKKPQDVGLCGTARELPDNSRSIFSNNRLKSIGLVS
jgi:hypothetical protein